jgi:outer membrane protein TolC
MDAREIVVLAVAGTYLQTLADISRVESQKAQVANAQAVYDQAVVRKEAGTNARIDVTRSAVELQTQQQRLNALQADLQKQQITLARIIGLPQDRALVLSEVLSANPAHAPDAAQAIAQATSLRSDLRAAETQVHAAELALSAAHAERLPSLSLSGNYGALGPNPANAHGVFTVTGTVNIPIYQGGRVRADVEQAEATIAQRRAELADQKAHVEQEVRNALIELQTANGQLKLTQANRDFARETLTQARDRFAAGVSTTLEVVQAQEQVASAESDYISSLFALDLARVSLARATGQAENEIPNLLKEDHR